MTWETVSTNMEMHWQGLKSFSNHSPHYSVLLSLQIQFHSATANFRCFPSRIQCQPISIEQTEIGNSLPVIDPVTLKLATQTLKAANKASGYACVFLFSVHERRTAELHSVLKNTF